MYQTQLTCVCMCACAWTYSCYAMNIDAMCMHACVHSHLARFFVFAPAEIKK